MEKCKEIRLKEYFLLEAQCGVLGLGIESDVYGLGPDKVIITAEDRLSIPGNREFDFYVPCIGLRLSRSYSKETIDNIFQGNIDKSVFLKRALNSIIAEIDSTMERLGQLEELRDKIKKMLQKEIEEQ